MHVEPEVRRKLRTQRCPICNSIEGCDHTVNERLRAMSDIEFRDRLRAEDPLYRPALANKETHRG